MVSPSSLKKPVCCVLFVLAALTVGCSGSEERQAEYLARAKEHYESGNLEKARIEAKNVLQINPKNAEGRYYLGLIAERDKNFREAFGNFSTVIENEPGHVRALNKLTEYYMASKDYEKATEMAGKAYSVAPKNADTLANLAAIKMAEGNKDDAMIDAQEALSIEPGHVKAVSVLTALYSEDNPEMALETITAGIKNQTKNEALKVLKLRLLASQGKREQVVNLYKELINEYPEKHVYTLQLVNFYLQDSEQSEDRRRNLAEKTLRDLVKSAPDNEQAKLWLVEFLMKNRGQEAAKTELIQYVDSSANASGLKDALANIYMSEDDFEAAHALYRPVIQENPTSVQSIEARNRLVEIFLRQGEREKAEGLQEEILDLEPENTAALITNARLKLSDNEFSDAISDLRVVLKNEPESAKALFLLAQAHERNNAPDLALDNYQRLLNIQPNNLPALVSTARLLMSKGQADKALSLLEAAGENSASHPEVAKILTDLYSRNQQWDDALSASAGLLETKQTAALGHYLQGRVYLRSGEFDNALDSLNRSIELEPGGIETLSAIVAAYQALEQTDKALQFVKQHVEEHPEHIHAKELLAGIYARQRDIERATKLAEEIVENYPDRVSAYTLLGRLYAAAGKLEKTEQMYLQAIPENPGQTVLRSALAELYQATNRPDQAIEQYESILNVSPDHMIARNNLASLLLDRDENPETVQRAAELSTDLATSRNPAFLDTAGWAQYKLGNYAQAVSLLGAAVENGGKGAVFHYHLGMAYYKSDLLEQAKKQLTLALEDEEASFVGREEAQEVLGSL